MTIKPDSLNVFTFFLVRNHVETACSKQEIRRKRLRISVFPLSNSINIRKRGTCQRQIRKSHNCLIIKAQAQAETVKCHGKREGREMSAMDNGRKEDGKRNRWKTGGRQTGGIAVRWKVDLAS